MKQMLGCHPAGCSGPAPLPSPTPQHLGQLQISGLSQQKGNQQARGGIGFRTTPRLEMVPGSPFTSPTPEQAGDHHTLCLYNHQTSLNKHTPPRKPAFLQERSPRGKYSPQPMPDATLSIQGCFPTMRMWDSILTSPYPTAQAS